MSRPDNHLYEFGQFVLDARSRIVLKDGVTVRLTPKAFDTLLVLIQHDGQLVDKEQLLKEVWPDTFVEEGSLSRNIHELRKALGDDTAEPRYIETISKRGYRFVAPVKVSGIDAEQIAPATSPLRDETVRPKRVVGYRSSRTSIDRRIDWDVCLSETSRPVATGNIARQDHTAQIDE